MQSAIFDLQQNVESYLPEFAKACKGQEEIVIMHQDAFAADYQNSELYLLGCAVKYAGLHGKVIHVIGRNGSTLKEPK